MRLLDRYLFRELLTPFLLCLGGFLIFWVSFDLFQRLNEMQENKLHALDVLEYAAAMVPAFLVLILPIILLLAVLYALTTHSRHNEITAMRAAGMSLWRICVPYYFTGVLAAGACYVLNEYAVPGCADWADRIMHRYTQHDQDVKTTRQLQNLDFKNADSSRKWHMGEFHPLTGEIIQPRIVWYRPDGSSLLLVAELGQYTNGVWTFFNAKEYVKDYAASNNAAPPLVTVTNLLTVPEFDERPAQFANELKIDQYRHIDNSDLDIPLPDIVSYLRHHPHLTRRDRGWLLTQLHARFATPATCLVVVLIAVPFGATTGRRNLFTGVASSIFICFFFIILQKISLALGTNGTVPAWLAAWLPNSVFAATGLFLTWRAK